MHTFHKTSLSQAWPAGRRNLQLLVLNRQANSQSTKDIAATGQAGAEKNRKNDNTSVLFLVHAYIIPMALGSHSDKPGQ